MKEIKKMNIWLCFCLYNSSWWYSILKIHHEESVHMEVIGTKMGISDARSRRLRASEMHVWVPITPYVRLLNVVFCLLHVNKSNQQAILVWFSLIVIGECSVATLYFFKSIILFFENRPNYTFFILLYFFLYFFLLSYFFILFFPNLVIWYFFLQKILLAPAALA